MLKSISILCGCASCALSFGCAAAAPVSGDTDSENQQLSKTDTSTPCVASIAAGANHSCAITGAGVYCWGGNQPAHFVAGLPTRAQAISAGVDHNCAKVDGGAYCWGQNETGQLGNGTTVDSEIAVQAEHTSSAVGAGAAHSCAIVKGRVECWGYNYVDLRHFGDPDAKADVVSLVPVRVEGLPKGATAIALGMVHTCAIARGGAYCWGANLNGELGDGSTTDSLVAVPVVGLSSGVTAIAAGNSASCAVVGGGVWCWGSGLLGNGTASDSPVPVPVPALTSEVTALAAGANFMCALVRGAVYCWGSNWTGQLGNGTYTDSLVPVQVMNLGSGVTAVDADGGGQHACAIQLGIAVCWGRRVSGQLGAGSGDSSPVPLPVQFPFSL